MTNEDVKQAVFLQRQSPYIFYIWLVCIFFLSAYNFNAQLFPAFSNKAVHFFMYFITALVSYVYFLKFIKIKKLNAIASVFFACGYGILMEFMQYFIPYRNFSTDDIVSNCLGAIIFGIIVLPKRKLTINGQKI